MENAHWFDFALDPQFMHRHFSKANHCPTADKLISNLVERSDKPTNVEVPVGGGSPQPSAANVKSQKLFKRLSLRMLAYYSWNIDMFENTVPSHIIHLLLQELLVIVEESSPASSAERKALAFSAEVLYNVWVLNAVVSNSMIQRPLKLPPNIQLNLLADPMAQHWPKTEETFKLLRESLSKTVKSLEDILTSTEINSHLLVHSSYTLLAHTGNFSDADKYDFVKVPASEAKARIRFVLGKYYFQTMNFTLAREHFEQLYYAMYDINDSEFSVFPFDREILSGYLLAVGVDMDSSSSTLNARFEKSMENDCKNIVDILLEDNQARVLTWRQRLSVSDALVAHKQMQFQVDACNTVRRALEGSIVCGRFIASLRHCTAADLSFLLMVINRSRSDSSNSLARLRRLLRTILTSCKLCVAKELERDHSPPLDLLLTEERQVLVCGRDPQVVFTHSESPASPTIGSHQTCHPLVSPHADKMRLENQFVCSADPADNKLQRLLETDVTFLVGGWIPPIWNEKIRALAKLDPLVKARLYLSVGKAARLLAIHEYRLAHNWFMNAAQQAMNSVFSFSPILKAEALHARLVDSVIRGTVLGEELAQEAAAILPDARSEVADVCVLALINAGCASVLMNALARSIDAPMLKLAGLLALCQAQSVGGHVAPSIAFETRKELLMLILDIHSQSNVSTGDEGPAPKRIHMEKTYLSRSRFLNCMTQVRDIRMLDPLLACLARIFNILNNENLLEDLSLGSEPGWREIYPIGTIPTMKSVSNSVEHSLNRILVRAIALEPFAPKLYRAAAQIALFREEYRLALKYLTILGCVGTRYFTRQTVVWSEDDLRKLVQCCERLSYNITGVHFVQMMREPDYSRAFSLIQSDFSLDCGDYLYRWLFDKTILECIINVHTQRIETGKRNVALSRISQIDLNDNNSDEIRREVRRIATSRFCQSCVKLWL